MGKLPFDQFFVCINTETKMVPVNEFELDRLTAHQINYSESKARYIHANSTNNKKTDEDNSTKECITNDMEDLYWHTHGSMLWQR